MFGPMINKSQQGNPDPRQAIQQFAMQVGNPQNLVQKFFGFVPQNIQNDPNQIINYLVSSGRVSQEQIDIIRAYIAQNGIK